jgi:pre-mRNA-processing factor SLU7
LEYSHDGRLIKGPGVAHSSDKVTARTKYEEDVYINNHLSVWGSYFSKKKMAWGYECCHSLFRNSYCTGEKGKVANDEERSVLIYIIIIIVNFILNENHFFV